MGLGSGLELDIGKAKQYKLMPGPRVSGQALSIVNSFPSHMFWMCHGSMCGGSLQARVTDELRKQDNIKKASFEIL